MASTVIVMHEKQAGAGSFQERTVGSRTRYALVWTGLNTLVVFGILIPAGALAVRTAVLWGIPLVLMTLTFLLQGWVWYPRAKQKLTTEPGPKSPGFS